MNEGNENMPPANQPPAAKPNFEAEAAVLVSKHPTLSLKKEIVIRCLEAGMDFGKRGVIKKLEEIKAYGGDPNLSLEKKLDELREQTKKKVGALGDLADKMKEILAIFQREPEHCGDKERKILEDLASKIAEVIQTK